MYSLLEILRSGQIHAKTWLQDSIESSSLQWFWSTLDTSVDLDNTAIYKSMYFYWLENSWFSFQMIVQEVTISGR